MKSAATTLLFLLALFLIAPPAQAATFGADDTKAPALFQRASSSQAPAILSRDAFTTPGTASTGCDLCADRDGTQLESMTLEYTGPDRWVEFRVTNPDAGSIFGPTFLSSGDIIFLERPGNSKGIGNNAEILVGGNGTSGSGTVIDIYKNGVLTTSKGGKAYHTSCSDGTPLAGDILAPSASSPSYSFEVLGGGNLNNPNACPLIDLKCETDGAGFLIADKPNPQPGDVVTFTAPFTNEWNHPASNVQVTATYPTSAFENPTASNGGIVSTPGQIVFNIGAVAAGATVTRTFTLTVKSGASNGTVTASVTAATETDLDSTPGNVGVIATEDDECQIPFANLPVELTAFDAQADGRSATLTWRTASETNNAGFELQHRYLDEAGSSKKEFTARAFIEGHGTTTEAQSYSFRLDNLEPGRHVFRLKQIDYDGTFDYSPEIEIAVDLPEAFLISPVYPNPFNPQASFSFSVSRSQQVTVSVYNMLGQRVLTLFDGVAAQGTARTLQIDGSGLESGTYIVRVLGESFVNTQTITLVK